MKRAATSKKCAYTFLVEQNPCKYASGDKGKSMESELLYFIILDYNIIIILNYYYYGWVLVIENDLYFKQ